ncbi:MAG TPA: HD domain-containing phosphohydrolase [Gemmatimonadales bacterium]|nr:HD domain-containing phosphohydrolase [Gemmatimonadales bacterium]
MRFLLLHSPLWVPGPLADALAAESVETRSVAHASGIRPDHRPTVLLIDPLSRGAFPARGLIPLAEVGLAIVALGGPGEQELPDAFPADALSAFIAAPVTRRRLLLALRTGFREAATRLEAHRVGAEAALRTNEVAELTEIGSQLLTERDHRALLDTILDQALRLSQSDAGSLYLVERNDDDQPQLRFKLTRNHSRPDIAFSEIVIPIDETSLAGYAALTNEPLVLDDVYQIPSGSRYSFNSSFDERHGYRTRSVLVIPMANHRGEVTGVLQLINRKTGSAPLRTAKDMDRRVVPYDLHTVRLMRALAGHAAVSVENNQLYQSIERLFEGFVRAAVTAIEQRDPGTSGHSARVAGMTVALASAVDRERRGPHAAVRFTADQIRELRYAALLHDFGKVGVREEVLVKPRKLPDRDRALIQQRHAFLLRTAEWRFERARADYLERCGRQGYDCFLEELRTRRDAEMALVKRFLDVVTACDEPTVLPQGDFCTLQQFAKEQYEDVDGTLQPFLRPEEIRYLTIRQGSLDEAERREIESHVSHTYDFLQRIPWTPELERVPEIAWAHHEKLDGTGYPRGIAGEEIPIQTRIMTITDIYDALSAADRPYKRAVDQNRALDILGEEVKAGLLDAALFKLFLDAKIYLVR